VRGHCSCAWRAHSRHSGVRCQEICSSLERQNQSQARCLFIETVANVTNMHLQHGEEVKNVIAQCSISDSGETRAVSRHPFV